MTRSRKADILLAEDMPHQLAELEFSVDDVIGSQPLTPETVDLPTLRGFLATEKQLAAEKENQLYKDVTVRVQAEQHLGTKSLRKLRLIEFSPQTAEVDEQALASLWEKGRRAWKDVTSPTAWVEALRGNL